MKSTFKYKGIVDGRPYTLEEKKHLIKFTAQRGANVYIYYGFSWESAYEPPGNAKIKILESLAESCAQNNVEFWIGMKPGDFRYCMHKEDRKNYIKNAKTFLNYGADGIYIVMDDTHPGCSVRPKDAEFQAKLISETYNATGKVKAICGEEYHGRKFKHKDYWKFILNNLPKDVMITTTGPGIWNRLLNANDMPEHGWPILLWDNFFASDSWDPKRAPAYPLTGRSPDLASKVTCMITNLDFHYPWQFIAMHSFMDYCSDPYNYSNEYNQGVSRSYNEILDHMAKTVGIPEDREHGAKLRLMEQYWDIMKAREDPFL